MKKRPWNDVGAEARFWGGGRMPPDPRWRFVGSIWDPKLAKNRVFPMCKTMPKHDTVVKKRGLARLVWGLENHQKTSKMTSESVPKFMKNRCGNDARKSDAKITGNGAKMEPKGEPKSSKMCKKCMQKTMPKIDTKKGHTRDHGGEVGGSLLLRLNKDRQYLPTVTTQTVTKKRQ